MPLEALASASVFRKLYDNRILYLRGPIEDTVADTLVAQLMSLDAESDEEVTLYINSPGGLVSGVFAVYDVMNLMKAKVNTRRHRRLGGRLPARDRDRHARGHAKRADHVPPAPWWRPRAGGGHPDPGQADRLPARAALRDPRQPASPSRRSARTPTATSGCRPRTRSPTARSTRFAAPAASDHAGQYRWQCGQAVVPRPATVPRRGVCPQRGHGRPA